MARAAPGARRVRQARGFAGFGGFGGFGRRHREAVEGHAQAVDVEAESPEHLAGRPLHVEDAEQHVLAPDEVAAAGVGEAHRAAEGALDAGCAGERAGRRRVAERGTDGLADLVAGGREGHAGVGQHPGGGALAREQAEEQVLGAEVVVAELARLDLGAGDRAPGGGVEAAQVAGIGAFAHRPIVARGGSPRWDGAVGSPRGGAMGCGGPVADGRRPPSLPARRRGRGVGR